MYNLKIKNKLKNNKVVVYLSLALFAWRRSLSLWALITGSSSSSSALEQLREFLLHVVKLFVCVLILVSKLKNNKQKSELSKM